MADSEILAMVKALQLRLESQSNLLQKQFENQAQIPSQSLQQHMATFDIKLDDLHLQIHSSTGSTFKSPVLPRIVPDSTEISPLICPPKIDFPKFDSSNVENFILRIEEYFDSLGTMEELRLCFVAIHVEGQTFYWFRRMKDWGLLTSWKWFPIHLRGRFETVVVSNDERKKGARDDKSGDKEPTMESQISSRVAVQVAAPEEDQNLFDEMSVSKMENSGAQVVEMQQETGNKSNFDLVPCEIACQDELKLSENFISAYIDEMKIYSTKGIEIGGSFGDLVCFTDKILGNVAVIKETSLLDGEKNKKIDDYLVYDGCLLDKNLEDVGFVYDKGNFSLVFEGEENA